MYICGKNYEIFRLIPEQKPDIIYLPDNQFFRNHFVNMNDLEHTNLDRFKLGDRYETIEYIGSGTTGVVYKSKILNFDVPVAIKVLRPELTKNEKFIKFLNHEIAPVFTLNHPNIINVKELTSENGKHFIVMEYVKGKNLEQLLDEKKVFSVEEAVPILEQLALAINYASEKNVIHKAIKPQNILISDENIVKLSDFGLSKAITAAWLTITGSTNANVEYMSPEQAEGEEIDHRSDIYSFGIIAYLILTGEVPFKRDGASILSLAMKHINVKPEPLSVKKPEIPNWLENMVLKCLEKKPENRFKSGKEIFTLLKNNSQNTGVMFSENPENDPPQSDDTVSEAINNFQNSEVVLSEDNSPQDEVPVFGNTETPQPVKDNVSGTNSDGKRTIDIESSNEVSSNNLPTSFIEDNAENIIDIINQNEITKSFLYSNQNQIKLLLFLVIILELIIIGIFVFILFSP